MQKYIVLGGILILINSCSFQGTLQGLFTYQRTYVKENPELFTIVKKCNKNSLTYHPNSVIILNGKALKTCMKRGRVLVYIWSPLCNSDVCIPLNLLQQECNDLNIALYVVAEYYDLQKMSKIYDIKNTIIAIDNRYYNTIFVTSQLKKFMSDLTGIENFQEINKRCHLFVNNKYIHSGERLTDVFKVEIESQ